MDRPSDEAFARELNYVTTLQPETRLGRFERDYLVEDYMQMPTYELGEDYMFISDVAWGHCEIGKEPYDQLLIELARTPLFRRLQAVEQLTLGDAYATMPNTTKFSRWQHIWGSVVFVRKMLEGNENVSSREKMILQLRTLLSDVGHTDFSHLGDWLFQADGAENLHDLDLKQLLEITGIAEILQKHDIALDEVIFPEVDDWVECPSPDLCVDRVDYGMREILRWGAPTVPMNMILSELKDPQKVFEIDENNQLIMKHPLVARWFAAGFSILPTEHWAHPVHRLQLQLLQGSVQAALVNDAHDEGQHPRSLLYGIDSDFDMHFNSWEFIHLNHTMKDIAVWQRRIFVTARRADLEKVFTGIAEPDWQFPEFPDPLKAYTWQSKEYGRPYPPHLDVEKLPEGTKHEKSVSVSDKGLVMVLPPLKARAIDPQIRTEDGSIKRLSEIEPAYKDYLAGQRQAMATGYKATILMRPDIAERIVKKFEEAEAAWPQLLELPRDPQYLRNKIDMTEGYAAGHRFDRIVEV